MDFFKRQDISRKKTALLVGLFILAVAAVIVAIYPVAAVISFWLYLSDRKSFLIDHGQTSVQFQWIDPNLFLWVTLITLIIVVIGNIVKITALARGGSCIAEGMGGRLIAPSTTDRDERKLYNVVEEMAIASGISVPQTYVLDKEEGINAFAAGYTSNDAVVAVTQGCLKLLNRDELQGIVAHEYSHILNGDMRLNIRLIGWLAGIMDIHTLGKKISFDFGALSPGSMNTLRPDSSSGLLVLLVIICVLKVIGLVLLVVGYGGVFVGRIIQCAVSRQREFLADASAVQFTRNPPGLAGALKKIGECAGGSLIKASAAREACHMFFGKAVKYLLATHPPLEERIRLLDPSFDGRFAAVVVPKASPAQMHAKEFAEQPPTISQAAAQIAMDAEKAVNYVGTLSPENVAYGSELIAVIPVRLRQETNHPLGAMAIICGILLDKDPVKRGRQISDLPPTAASQPLLGEMLKLAPAIQAMEPRFLLPLVDLAMPALRQLSPAQYENFTNCLKTLVESDNQTTLFEFAVQTVVRHRLAAVFEKRGRKTARYNSSHLKCDLVRLLSTLAYAGHSGEPESRQAFSATASVLPKLLKGIEILPFEEISLERLGRVLDRLSEATPKIKKIVFEACAHCVLFDEKVSIEEAELLRAVAYSLDLPLPPFLPQAS